MKNDIAELHTHQATRHGELLAENPVYDIVAESRRVMEILRINPASPEVDALLDAPVFQGVVVDSYFQSAQRAAESGEHQDHREQRWLERVIGSYGYSTRQSRTIVLHALSNYTTDNGSLRPWQSQHDAFLRKLDTLEDLSAEDPGAPLALTTRWGITCFERYSADTLLRQLEHPDTTEELCVTPRSDHNGAFTHMEMKVAGYADRPFFVEAGSATELARIAVRLRQGGRRFGKVVIAAHSDGRDLTLNKYDMGPPLGVRQLSQQRVRSWVSALGVLSDQAEIQLMACSTGQPGGIQDELFKLPEAAKIAAPTEAAGSRTYGVGVRHLTDTGKDVGRVLQKTR